MVVKQWSNTTTEPIYERNAPCSCACPECTAWESKEGDATYPVLAADNGKCYSRTKNNIALTMPSTQTITVGFCISARNIVLPYGNFLIYPAGQETVKFYVDGVAYDYVTVDYGGEACICYDGDVFIVTGDVSGWNRGPS